MDLFFTGRYKMRAISIIYLYVFTYIRKYYQLKINSKFFRNKSFFQSEFINDILNDKAECNNSFKNV